jgi:type I restriction enzyme R subunit
MDKRNLSERDICTKFITPALRRAGWDEMLQIREEVSFTKGRINVRGKLVSRGKAKRADYILYFKPNIQLALIEAKDNSHSVGDGMQQALEYAATLEIPFVFSSNGDGFVFHDKTGTGGVTETNLALDAFPSPADLWARYRKWKGLTVEAEEIVLQDYYDDGSGKTPRYYQVNAINATIEAIAKARDRVLLVMATVTGKTYTAFQIIWRLWKAKRKKRILFLADRNVLVDQTMVNDFRPFGGVMAKLSTDAKTIERSDGTEETLTTAIGSGREINKSYEVYLALYQAITGPAERQTLFREFTPGFFDLIVVDECHRGSAAEDSAWRASGAQATMPKINQSTLVNLPIPFPPLSEQQRIVAKIDELMALCDRLEGSLNTGNDVRRKLLNALLAEALTPGDEVTPMEMARVAAHG